MPWRRQVCNHPDLFEARQIDSPFVMTPLELSIGSRVLRSSVRFPAGPGSVENLLVEIPSGRVGGEGGDGGGSSSSGAREELSWAGLSGTGTEGVFRVLGGGVSRRLIAPLWAHDFRGNSCTRTFSI